MPQSKTFFLMMLSLFFLLSQTNLRAEQEITSSDIPIIVEFTKIQNDSSTKIPDANELITNTVKSIQGKYNFAYQEKTNITILLSLKLWNDRDRNLFCQIDAELKYLPNPSRPLLQIISAVSPTENFSLYIQNAISKICRDLLLANNIIKIWINPTIETSHSAKSQILSQNNESVIDLTAPIAFSQVKASFTPPPPSYPLYAKANRISANIIVILTINPQGVPVVSQIVQGNPALNETALSYSLKWRFDAAKLNGINQWCRFKLTLPFKL